MKASRLFHPAVVTPAVLVLALLQAYPFTTPKSEFWAHLGAAVHALNLAVVVTALYVGLVYLQFKELRDQRAATRARLHFLDTCHHGRGLTYDGWAYQCPVQNDGPGMARDCQILLTHCKTLTNDSKWVDAVSEDGQHIIAATLPWSAHQPALGPRDLIPGRPYLFDLGAREGTSGSFNITTLDSLTPLLSLGPGRHCVEITALAANHDRSSTPPEPGCTVAWFQLDVAAPGLKERHPEIRLLAKPPWPKAR